MQLYVDMLNDVAKDVSNFKFWENPLKVYEEDDGMHPSPQQTEQLLKYMDAMFAQQHGLTYLLKSATSEIITTNRKYNKVNSLYKFGCSACSSRKKNKWFYICTDCKSNIASDTATKEATTRFRSCVQTLEDQMAPTLPTTKIGDGQRSRSPLDKSNQDQNQVDINTTRMLHSVAHILEILIAP